jgi:hypothetical protein
VGPRASLDILEGRKIFCPCQDSNLRPSSQQHRCYANYTTLASKERASTSSQCVCFLPPIHWVFIISQHESHHPVINLCLIFCIHTFLVHWYSKLEDSIFYFSEGCISDKWRTYLMLTAGNVIFSPPSCLVTVIGNIRTLLLLCAKYLMSSLLQNDLFHTTCRDLHFWNQTGMKLHEGSFSNCHTTKELLWSFTLTWWRYFL